MLIQYLLKFFLLINLFVITSLSFAFSQPFKSFRPFDWVLFKASGSITSFAEGYSFIYVATNLGGIKRFNLYGNYFDNPITTAQGLENNRIDAVHFDKKTGFLWASTPEHIQYSFSREGDWFSKTFKDIGLSGYDKITQIGSSDNYVWLKARSSYVKLDRSSGIMVGIYPIPDELNILWSSGEYRKEHKSSNDFTNFVVLDGWILNGNELIAPNGNRENVTTVLFTQYGNVFLGSDDGNVFFGSKTMETITPISVDIVNADVVSLHLDNYYLWVGSQNYLSSKGISKLDVKSSESVSFNFEETINMQPSPIYSMTSLNNELWAGGEGIILYHHKQNQFWKTLDQSRGIPGGIIWDLCVSGPYLWMGTSIGLKRLEMSTHSVDLIGIEQYFRDTQVYSIKNIKNEIWIGSKSGLYIYSSNDPKLANAFELQKKEELINNFFNFTVIQEYDNQVYVAGDMGIAKFDIESKKWKLILSSAVYGNKMIYSMLVNDNFLFLGTSEGLSRVNKRTGLIRKYNYPFIGQVNDLVLDGNTIWIGSVNGLIKFKWKRDL